MMLGRIVQHCVNKIMIKEGTKTQIKQQQTQINLQWIIFSCTCNINKGGENRNLNDIKLRVF